MEQALIRLRDNGDGEPADLPMFDVEDVWAFEKKWGGQQ